MFFSLVLEKQVKYVINAVLFLCIMLFVKDIFCTCLVFVEVLRTALIFDRRYSYSHLVCDFRHTTFSFLIHLGILVVQCCQRSCLPSVVSGLSGDALCL